jgi:acetyltransferase-like isoleucine patch superfamily enzyme
MTYNAHLGHGSVLHSEGIAPAILERVTIVCGSDCTIRLHGIDILNTRLHIHMANQCHLEIGPRTLINGPLDIYLHEPSRVVIGEDCLFAQSQLWTSDMHSIIDRTSGARVNPARDIRIGNHVWVGENALILKGAEIGDGSVVGARSVVNQRFPPNVVVAGAPARIVRRDVDWDQRLL